MSKVLKKDNILLLEMSVEMESSLPESIIKISSLKMMSSTKSSPMQNEECAKVSMTLTQDKLWDIVSITQQKRYFVSDSG